MIIGKVTPEFKARVQFNERELEIGSTFLVFKPDEWNEFIETLQEHGVNLILKG